MHPVLAQLVSWSGVLVAAVFGLIVLTTYWPGKRKYYERQAEIPLHDSGES